MSNSKSRAPIALHTLRLRKVATKHGAPMGRGNRVSSEKDIDLKFKLGVVQLSDGGYDNGGAYWGERIDGETLYVARSVKKTRVYGAWMDLTGDPVEDSEKIDDYVLLFADALNPAQAVRFFRRIYPNAIFV